MQQEDFLLRKKAKAARNRKTVRWYLMIYPYGRKGLLQGLEREIARRLRNDEPPIEYFAPAYVEAKEVNGRIVKTEKQLLYNYVFVHASENEIFKLKKYEDQYNLPRRETTSEEDYYYPYVSDETMQNLRWIAQSYSGILPVLTGDTSWLMKGDRVRITAGPFKGIEAQLFDNKKINSKEIIVMVDQWMSVPLLHIKDNEYKVIGLNGTVSEKGLIINDDLLPQFHEILCRSYEGKTTDEEKTMVRGIIARYAGKEPESDIMRCKLYSLQLMASTILVDDEHKNKLISIINSLLPALTAEYAKALLLTTLYGCTDSSAWYRQAHALVDPWRSDPSPKKNKKQLIQRLADFDRILGHLLCEPKPPQNPLASVYSA